MARVELTSADPTVLPQSVFYTLSRPRLIFETHLRAHLPLQRWLFDRHGQRIRGLLSHLAEQVRV